MKRRSSPSETSGDHQPPAKPQACFVSLPFDATLKDLVQAYPRDWLAALGLPATGPVAALNVDLSTLTAAGDVVLGVGYPPELVVDAAIRAGVIALDPPSES